MMSNEKSEGCAPDMCGSCSVAGCGSRQEAGAAPAAAQQQPAARGQALHTAPGQDNSLLNERLGRIKRKIIVMSGKGGVGKSTVAVNLAMSAMMAGQRVGILDVDLHGPSVPIMLGLEGHRLQGGENGMIPVEIGGLKVLSAGFLLHDKDAPVVWRGPMKMGVIRQFIEDVDWGDLDLLVVDVPPGTGDEPLSITQLIPDLEGAVIVTTPQKVAAADVRKSINFCKDVGVKVLGVVENMSGFACPKCHEVTPILSVNGGKTMAEEMGVPFLGSIPIDPVVAVSGDEGRAFVESSASSAAAGAFRAVVRELME